MDPDEELYRHEVRPWTVGQLRSALAGLPEDLPLIVHVAEEAGGDDVDRQVVIAAGGVLGRKGDRLDETPYEFQIDCEFPSGEYVRRRR